MKASAPSFCIEYDPRQIGPVFRSGEGRAFCGIAVSGPRGASFHTATAAGIAAGQDTFWRSASLSKLVTGRTAHSIICADNLQNEPVEDILGIAFRAPDGTRPTPAQLASHQSGLTDAGGYVIAPDQPLGDWLRAQGGAIWSGAAPGTQFEYSNLGFVVLAACAERVAGASFADLSHRLVLKAQGDQRRVQLVERSPRYTRIAHVSASIRRAVRRPD